MAVRESLLNTINSIATSDFVRAVTSAGASSKVTVSNLAKAIVENYTGSTLAGSSQSVKSALDSLNSKCTVKWFEVSGTPNQYGSLVFPNDLEALWGERRITGFMNVSSQVALVNVTYSGGKHYFTCWNTQTSSAITSSILIEVAYL